MSRKKEPYLDPNFSVEDVQEGFYPEFKDKDYEFDAFGTEAKIFFDNGKRIVKDFLLSNPYDNGICMRRLSEYLFLEHIGEKEGVIFYNSKKSEIKLNKWLSDVLVKISDENKKNTFIVNRAKIISDRFDGLYNKMIAEGWKEHSIFYDIDEYEKLKKENNEKEAEKYKENEVYNKKAKYKKAIIDYIKTNF